MAATVSTGTARAVGRYVLHGEIASGGMATVHFGRLQGAAGFSRSVAIKRLHPQFAKDPDFVAMFVDEARLAARVIHPNVVATLDVVTLEGELLLVMEYVQGASLSRVLKNLTKRGETLPIRIAGAIASGVLHGLHAAHDAKSENGEPLHIVHRDVSPQNVLVGSDGIARVLDFGVAKATGRWQSTRDGQIKGKMAYMAPEQLTTGDVTRRTDVYAASVVLWEMLTGRRLFRGDSDAKLMALVLNGEVPTPSDIVPTLPPALDQIVLRGLDRDPAKRFATAREMAAALEAVVRVAHSSEVGEWLEHVAADELRERAERVAEIERRLPPSLPPPGPTGLALGDRPSQESHLAMVHTDPSWLRSPARRKWAAALAGVVALTAATVGILWKVHGPHVDVARNELPPVAAPIHPSASPGPALPPPIPVEALPAASPTVDASRPSPPPSNPPARVQPARVNRGVSPRASSPPPAAAPAASSDCSPPYTTDRQGHVHFKANCL